MQPLYNEATSTALEFRPNLDVEISDKLSFPVSCTKTANGISLVSIPLKGNSYSAAANMNT